MLKHAVFNPKSNSRNRRGAVMVETVLIMPVLFVVFVLIFYLGWNIRRLEKTTQMDRYEAWRAAMPGSPGPGHSHENGHEQMNDAFFTQDTSDTATRIGLNASIGRSQYEAHDLLLTQLTEEDFAYYQDFIDTHPATVYARFEATHEPFSPMLTELGMSESTRNGTGFRVRNGDWRFADGIRFSSSRQEWEPGNRRITPNPALRNVFYAQFDEELDPLVGNQNPLADATQSLYLSYPGYIGPRVTNDSQPGN
ncbi:MAG: hypothetical protein AAGH88_13975 [Planctomycetota bacterium]